MDVCDFSGRDDWEVLYDTVLASSGCDSIAKHTVLYHPAYDIMLDTHDVCFGDSVNVFGVYRYGSGVYARSDTTSEGCDSIERVAVNLHMPPVFMLPDTVEICNDGSFSNKYSDNYYYLWSTGDTSSELFITTIGDYSVTVSNNAGCVVYDSMIVKYTDFTKDDITLLVSDPVCYNSIDGVIDVNVSGGDYLYTFSWEIGETTDIVSGLSSGIYRVTISDGNNCSLDTFAVLESPPKPEVVILDVVDAFCPGQKDGEIHVAAQNGVAPYSYNWSGGGTGPDIVGIRSGEYYLTVSDNNLCVVIDTIIVGNIQGSCLTIPNAFTPNQDGVNEVWYVDMIETLYPEAEIWIFDRNGLLVFNAKARNMKWNGKDLKNNKLHIDSYHYILELNDDYNTRYTGQITILK
jgi:gliding motility-associated-like protein